MINVDTTQAKPIEIIHRLNIIQDPHAFNPREEYDHLGTMFCKHKRYTLGDKDADDIRIEDEETGDLNFPEGYTILPLYLYDHSGITMNTSGFHCPWDSGMVGYIYMSHEVAKKNWPNCEDWKEKAINCMKSEVEEYDDYITGNVYGFNYEQVAVNDDGEEQVLEEDSCWGFFGYDIEKNGIVDHLPVPIKECEVIRQ